MHRCLAHVSEDGSEQSVEAHLEGTAALVAGFAAPFGAGAQGRFVGLAHDIGKYSDAFQRRLLENGRKVDHATAGAVECARLGAEWAAFHAAGPLGPGPVDRLFFRPDALLLPDGRRLPGYGGVPARRAAASGRARPPARAAGAPERAYLRLVAAQNRPEPPPMPNPARLPGRRRPPLPSTGRPWRRRISTRRWW